MRISRLVARRNSHWDLNDRRLPPRFPVRLDCNHVVPAADPNQFAPIVTGKPERRYAGAGGLIGNAQDDRGLESFRVPDPDHPVDPRRSYEPLRTNRPAEFFPRYGKRTGFAPSTFRSRRRPSFQGLPHSPRLSSVCLRSSFSGSFFCALCSSHAPFNACGEPCLRESQSLENAADTPHLTASDEPFGSRLRTERFKLTTCRKPARKPRLRTPCRPLSSGPRRCSTCSARSSRLNRPGRCPPSNYPSCGSLTMSPVPMAVSFCWRRQASRS